MTFPDLGLSDEVCKAISEEGYETATPIQQKSIPHVLMGKDLLGTAQTGTGKTAAFLLPMIDVMAQGRSKPRMPRALVLEPTRELAAQVADSFDKYTKYQKLSRALLIGGLGMKEQEAQLDGTCDIIIATPGRLLDLFDRGRMMLSQIQFFVIDEADRMMDMGFMPDVERIVSCLPPRRQTLFFSATMPQSIRKLADKFLVDPREVEVAPPTSTADTVEQHITILDERDKRDALRALIAQENIRNALIFCNRKSDVKMLHKSMLKHGFDAVALHGDMDQLDRMATLEKFKTDQAKIMVCSDVAARGIDIQGLSHVFNFDVPFHAEDYIHRIGRTGRAGMTGRTFMLATAKEAKSLDAIQKLIGGNIKHFVIDGFGKKPAPAARPAAEPAAAADATGADASASAPAGATADDAPKEKRPRRARRTAKPKVAEAEAGVEVAVEATAEAATTTETAAATTDVVETAADAVVAGTVEEVAPKAPRKRAPRARRSAKTDAAVADAAPAAEAAPEKSAERAPGRVPSGDGPEAGRPSRAPRSRSGGRNRRDDGGDTPVGLGDHVPAFLLRPLRIGSDSESSDAA